MHYAVENLIAEGVQEALQEIAQMSQVVSPVVDFASSPTRSGSYSRSFDGVAESLPLSDLFLQ